MKKCDHYELLKKAGDLSGILGIRDSTMNDGRARGVRVFDLKNGLGLRASIFPDRGLDIPYLSFKETNIGLVTKSGISSPFSYTYSKDGADSFLRQFSGGFLTTCGITFSGAGGEDEGRELPMHGLVSNTIAENTAARQVYEQEELVLKVSGKVREARLFGENMVMEREITMFTESNRLGIVDTVQNLGCTRQPLMMLYHMNFGYPMLDNETRVYFSANKVEPQSEEARRGMERYHIMEEPQDSYAEQCFYHRTQPDSKISFAIVFNEKLKMAVKISYNPLECPILCQWKSMQSGDYALGIEPTTCGTKGRKKAREEGILRYVEANETYSYHIMVEVLTNVEEINKDIRTCKEYQFHN